RQEREEEAMRQQQPVVPDLMVMDNGNEDLGFLKTNGRGHRFIAVRGVWNLRAQVQELARAMGANPGELKTVQELVQLQNFHLERQTATGPNSWGPWKEVDRDPVMELLKTEIAGFAPEAVADGIVDMHICMPYPERVVGDWGGLATHPGVKDFVLSPEEIDE